MASVACHFRWPWLRRQGQRVIAAKGVEQVAGDEAMEYGRRGRERVRVSRAPMEYSRGWPLFFMFLISMFLNYTENPKYFFFTDYVVVSHSH